MRTTKLISIGRAAEAAGAVSITVHMSAKKQARLHRAAAAGKDIVQLVADDIARQFRKRDLEAPPLLFGIEIAAKTGKIHIHGFYVPADHTSVYFALVREAFTQALGKIKGQSGSTQFDAEPLYTPERWFSYFQKDAWRTERSLGIDKLLYVSNSILRFGKAAHEAARKTANDGFGSRLVDGRELGGEEGKVL